jgi:hypothetical protein
MKDMGGSIPTRMCTYELRQNMKGRGQLGDKGKFGKERKVGIRQGARGSMRGDMHDVRLIEMQDT